MRYGNITRGTQVQLKALEGYGKGEIWTRWGQIFERVCSAKTLSASLAYLHFKHSGDMHDVRVEGVL